MTSRVDQDSGLPQWRLRRAGCLYRRGRWVQAPTMDAAAIAAHALFELRGSDVHGPTIRGRRKPQKESRRVVRVGRDGRMRMHRVSMPSDLCWWHAEEANHNSFVENILKRLTDPSILHEIDARLTLIAARFRDLTAMRDAALHAQRYQTTIRNGETAQPPAKP